MKLSDLEKIAPLKKRLAEITAMEDGLCKYPPYKAALLVNGDGVDLDNQAALVHVRAARQKVVYELAALGVEAEE